MLQILRLGTYSETAEFFSTHILAPFTESMRRKDQLSKQTGHSFVTVQKDKEQNA